VSRIGGCHVQARRLLLAKLQPHKADYWNRYARGLQFAHHGERFGGQKEHIHGMSLAYEARQQRGQGYGDGLKQGEQ
jgi:hypothetical protein